MAAQKKTKRKRHAWKDIRRSSPERHEEIRQEVFAEIIEANLKEIRGLIGMTQSELADTLGAAQSHISQTEAREDHMVSTLREYVHALGGELEVIARFDDRTVRLRGV